MHIAYKFITFASMASIGKHISDLLCVHDCVIVPGLGGFVANHKPAVIVTERNQLQPPAKEIGFNRSLSHNDGLLAKHLCQREQISWDESIDRINAFVSDVLTKINQGESVRFQGIGTFRKDAVGNLQFSPREKNNLLPSAFGLYEFHYEPLPYTPSAKKHEEPVRQLFRSRSPRYWAAVAAMFAGLFLFTSELKMPRHQQIESGKLMPTTTQTETSDQTPASGDLNIEADEIENARKEETPVEKNEEETVTSPAPEQPDKSFHLIAASFRHEKPAKSVLDQLHNDGYTNARILESDNGRYRISLKAFPGREEAVQQLFALRKQNRFENIWLLTGNK